MRYVIYGAGAVGGAIGGLLHVAGLESVLICRGAQLEAVRARGLEIRTPAGEIHSNVAAAGHPRELRFRPDDVVVLTMKSQDTQGALADLEAAGWGDLPIICCQNGVENERIAARRFERVYAMLVQLSTDYLTPGRVTVYSAPVYGVLDCGRYPHGTDGLIEQVASDLTAAGFSSRAIADVMRFKYQKLIVNLINGLSALTNEPRSTPLVREIFRALTAEAVACYEAAGLDVAGRQEYEQVVISRWKTQEIPGERRYGTSTRQSLARGSPTIEVDHIHGEIVLLGKLYGVPTPINAGVRRLTQELARSGGPPGRYSAIELADLLRIEAATA